MGIFWLHQNIPRAEYSQKNTANGVRTRAHFGGLLS
jgi:hypothetical protein